MTTGAFKHARIMVVDDQEANVQLIERLLEAWGYPNVVGMTDSSQLVELCERTAPDLIMLDLHMPEPDGFQVMEMLAPQTVEGSRIPIIVLTADVTEATKERALQAGARDFLHKPFNPTEVRLRVENLLETRRLQLELMDQNVILEQRVHTRTRDLELARLEILERLALAGEFRDDNTQEHAQRVGRTAAALALEAGQSEQVELIRRAAPLHDIGKIGVSDTVLLKPGKLDPDEYAVMQTHAVIGAEILSSSGSLVLQLAEEIARTHHERWDGKGYPARLAGPDIPLVGRLVAIADVFDALSHQRPYKEAWPLEAVITEIQMLAGRHFDPDLVEVFNGLDHEKLTAPLEDWDIQQAAVRERVRVESLIGNPAS
jgi:putative two-component system response regulator